MTASVTDPVDSELAAGRGVAQVVEVSGAEHGMAVVDGETVVEETLDVTAEPGSSRPVWSVSAAAYRPGPERYTWVESPAGRLPANRLYFVEPRDLVRTPVPVRGVLRRRGDGVVEVEVTAEAFASFVVIEVGDPAARCDDNYLDLEAGSTRVVTIAGLPDTVDLDTIRVRNR